MVLKDFREQSNLTQAQLASKTDTTARVIQHYEQGTRSIDGAKIKTLLDLSLAVGCRISDLIADTELKDKLKKHGY